jgi:carbamoyltransferase
LSVAESAVHEHFDGPRASPFMECDYVPKDPGTFRHILPTSKATIRVHTVGHDAPAMFQALLRAFGDASGMPILVNTSFNGFREPIVCSPRDAVRVFFGTGLDVLVLGQFIVSK